MRQDAIRPFDQNHTRARKPFLGAQVQKIGFRRQPVSIDVVYQETCGILLQQYEGGAADIRRRSLQTFDDRTHESGLAGSHFPAKCHDGFR